MSDDLLQLEDWIGAVLARMEPAAQRKLLREVATGLRRAQVERIRAQRNPDGSAYAPRKRPPLRTKTGRVKKQAAMFRKLRGPGYLGQEVNSEGVAVGFRNSTVARIARVHQLGLRDRVERRRAAPEADYPARELLGFTEADRARILDQVLAHVEG